ncbi:MAG: hypothetical protein OXG52_12725, partial [bacterium]|nr:hypothetical protein [bacterium]
MRRVVSPLAAGLVLAGLAVPIAAASTPAAAQTQQPSYPRPWLHRTEITEGQSLEFLIANVPTGHSAYFLRVKLPTSSLTAQTADFTVWDVTNPNASQRSDNAVIVAPGTSEQVPLKGANPPRRRPGQPTPPPPTHGYVEFEAQATADNTAESGGETFGVQLCSTAACAQGTVFGDWTVTINDAGADITLSYSGAGTERGKIVVSGGSTTMMEATSNNDNADRSDTITVNFNETLFTGNTLPADGIVVEAVITPEVRDSSFDATSEGPIARVAGELVLERGTTERSFDLTVWSNNNIADAMGDAHTGTIAWQAFVNNANYQNRHHLVPAQRTTPDAWPTGGAAIGLPSVPITVTDDDPTAVEILAASTADDSALEGSTSETAKFRVKLARALAAGESLTAPLYFDGATLGTHFTIALDGSPTGVTLAGDSQSLTFTGGSSAAAEATLVVTAAANDGNTVRDQLTVSTATHSNPWQSAERFADSLAGGACSGSGCPYSGSTAQNSYQITLEEPGPNIVFVFGGVSPPLPASQTLLENKCHSSGNFRYQVKLATQPTGGDVTLTVGGDDFTFNPGSMASKALTFTSSDWNMLQTVDFNCDKNNSTDELDRTFTITHTASGGNYGSVSRDLAVTVTDDDKTTVTLSGGGTKAAPSKVMTEGD